MNPSGAFQIFRAFGIAVYLHWTWFILFWFLIQGDRGFSTPVWNVAVVLTIFAIVLLHEFGHALACRSVGGRAEHIMLWPLGGIAFVQPPPRPGAVLWSIAAGPLVNVVLVPITFVAMLGLEGAGGDIAQYSTWVFQFNLIILIFNMLPIYPLDGGQILQSLLWFVVGRAKSLRFAAGVGLVFAVVGGVLAISVGNILLILIAAFVGWQAWIGWRQAAYLAWREQEEGRQ